MGGETTVSMASRRPHPPHFERRQGQLRRRAYEVEADPLPGPRLLQAGPLVQDRPGDYHEQRRDNAKEEGAEPAAPTRKLSSVCAAQGSLPFLSGCATASDHAPGGRPKATDALGLVLSEHVCVSPCCNAQVLVLDFPKTGLTHGFENHTAQHNDTRTSTAEQVKDRRASVCWWLSDRKLHLLANLPKVSENMGLKGCKRC